MHIYTKYKYKSVQKGVQNKRQFVIDATMYVHASSIHTFTQFLWSDQLTGPTEGALELLFLRGTGMRRALFLLGTMTLVVVVVVFHCECWD